MDEMLSPETDAAASEQRKAQIRQGQILLFVSAALLISGFILTVVCYHYGSSIQLPMYGLTGTGILCGFVGLMRLF